MRIKPILTTLALAAAFVAPSGLLPVTALHAQVDVKIKVKRVYDPVHKDYHQWDDREDRSYHAYFTERHEEHRPYAKLKPAEQKDYWKWRHEHPDQK